MAKPKRRRNRAGRRAAQRSSSGRRVWFGALTVGALVVAALAVVAVVALGGGDESGPDARALAPDFELAGLDGEQVRLSDFRGRPVLLNFMHTF